MGAIYGQLAGAFYGKDAIPETWRSVLAFRELIEDFAEKLFLQNRARCEEGRDHSSPLL